MDTTDTADRPVIIPSDLLAGFAELLRRMPELTKLCGGSILCVKIVLDANQLLQDVVLAGKANDPTMRPHIEELMDCGVVRGLAPEAVRREVDEHLPRLLLKLDDERKARAIAAWERYQRKIHWIAESEYIGAMNAFPELARRDPDDVHLAAVHRVLGADVIVTADLDLLSSSEVPATSRRLMGTLRAYARAKATATMATTGPVIGIGTVLMAAFELFALVPDRLKLWVGLAVAGVALATFVLTAPETRVRLASMLRGALDWLQAAQPSVELAAAHEAEIALALPPRVVAHAEAAGAVAAPIARERVASPTPPAKVSGRTRSPKGTPARRRGRTPGGPPSPPPKQGR